MISPTEPCPIDALRQMAKRHMQAGEPDKALPLLRQAIQASPDDVDLRWNEAMALLAMGEIGLAVPVLVEINEATGGSDTAVLGFLAAALNCVGEFDLARGIEEALRQSGFNRPDIHDSLFSAATSAMRMRYARNLISAMLEHPDDPDAPTAGEAEARLYFRAIALGMSPQIERFSRIVDDAAIATAEAFKILASEDTAAIARMPTLPTIPDFLDRDTRIWLRRRLDQALRHREIDMKAGYCLAPLDFIELCAPRDGRTQFTNKPRSPILFYHIQRCGGTSLLTALSHLFPNNVIAASPEEIRALSDLGENKLAEMDLVALHYPTVLADVLSAPRQKWTMVRDPIRRVVSWYFGTALEKHPFVGDHSFESWVDMLCEPGMPDLPQNSTTYWVLTGMGVEASRWPHDIDKALDIAKNDYDFVGITELFDATLAICSMMSGNHFVPKWHVQRQSGSPATADLNQGSIRKLERFLEGEIFFYQRVRSAFVDKYSDVINNMHRIGTLKTA